MFDTWTLNCDRHSPDGQRINRNNVYLSEDAPPGNLLLRAMDHSHCFTCGGPLSPKIADIGQVKDDRIYGLFPEFVPWLDRGIVAGSVETLRSFTIQDALQATQTIPQEWDVDGPTQEALVRFLVSRAAFLASSIMDKLFPASEPVDLRGEAGSE